MSTSPHLGLALIASGTENWAGTMDNNLTIIDSAVYALQTGGSTGPAGPQGPAGPAGWVWAGAWSSSTAYIATNVVTYAGATYYALAASTNVEPDLNPNTWALLAAAGVAGPAGPTGPAGTAGTTGPQGPPGLVTYPITVAQGGTNATTAPAARTNLGAAASGVNSDITAVTELAATVSQAAVAITGPTGANAITWNNGVSGEDGGVTMAGVGDFTGINCRGGVVAGSLQASGVVLTGQITAAIPGGTIILGTYSGSSCVVLINNGLLLQGTPPTPSAGQVGIGGTTASTATAGGGQAVPTTVLTYLDVTLPGGVLGKIAIFAA